MSDTNLFLFNSYFGQVGVVLSFLSMLMFQVERLQVLRAPFLHEHIARKRCRLTFIIICLCSFAINLSALEVFSIFSDGHTLFCFITSVSILPMKYLIVVTFAFFYSLPLTALPVLDMFLIIKISQITKAHLELVKGAHSNSKLNEIKAAYSSVAVSIFMSICLTPNISWIPVAYGRNKIYL